MGTEEEVSGLSGRIFLGREMGEYDRYWNRHMSSIYSIILGYMSSRSEIEYPPREPGLKFN